MNDAIGHIPVLVEEVLAGLEPASGQIMIDATVGHGGHAEAYLQRTAPDGRVIGIDADTEAAARARERLRSYGDRVQIITGNFWQLKDSLLGGGILGCEATNPAEALLERSEGGSGNLPLFSSILFDLGVGSHQLADATRGFSFNVGQSLRMRYGSQELPPAQFQPLNYLSSRLGHEPDAEEILNGLKENELADLLWLYGEERHSRRIARAIKTAGRIGTAGQLAEIIAGASGGRGKIHPATRSFLALRLAVNRELEVLALALPQALDLLKTGGRLAIISFHSLEDRVVKNFLRSQAQAKRVRLITRKPIMAGSVEIERNRRARSAKLRLAEKLLPAP